MAINPPSDIVLGVVLAADPDKMRVAAERLRNLSDAAASARAAPSDPGEDAGWNTETAASAPDAALPPPRPPPGGTQKTNAAGDAFGKLEAFVLQSFIQSMLPKNATDVYGKGTAGDVWRSMLAEKLGDELARSGQIGIAKRLAEAHALRHAAPVAAMQAGIEAGTATQRSATAPVASVLPYLNTVEPAKPDTSLPAEQS